MMNLFGSIFTGCLSRAQAHGQSLLPSPLFVAEIILGHCCIWLASPEPSAPEPSKNETGKRPLLVAIVEREGLVGDHSGAFV